MRSKSELSDRELFRLGADNLRSSRRADQFDMPEAAEHWQREYEGVKQEFQRRDKERHG